MNWEPTITSGDASKYLVDISDDEDPPFMFRSVALGSTIGVILWRECDLSGLILLSTSSTPANSRSKGPGCPMCSLLRPCHQRFVTKFPARHCQHHCFEYFMWQHILPQFCRASSNCSVPSTILLAMQCAVSVSNFSFIMTRKFVLSHPYSRHSRLLSWVTASFVSSGFSP